MTRSEWLAQLEAERFDTSYLNYTKTSDFPKVTPSRMLQTKWMVAFHAGRWFQGARDIWAQEAWRTWEHREELEREARR